MELSNACILMAPVAEGIDEVFSMSKFSISEIYEKDPIFLKEMCSKTSQIRNTTGHSLKHA